MSMRTLVAIGLATSVAAVSVAVAVAARRIGTARGRAPPRSPAR